VDGSGGTIDSVDTDCDDTHEASATALSGDCDDTDAAYNPAAAETDCSDPNDYNCDGSSGYDDADTDGWAACEECDDADATVNPDATEVAGDRVDQDCDGAESCYVDADDDGYRPDATSVVSGSIACDGAGEAVASDPTTDCDDADAAAYPGATEVVGDEIDENCDGDEDCYVDADGDGYTATGSATVASADLLCDGAGEATDTTPAGDCDDTDAAYNPSALEEDCTDPADYNCDGSSGVVDGDGDGFYACEECDDALGTINPDADEVCDGADNDCDGTIDIDAIDAETWYADADGDGYTTTETVTACDEPEGYAAATDEDCDDDDATSNPAGEDVPDDGIDQDCDGLDATSADNEDTADAPDDKDGGKGCGCASTGNTGAVWSLLLGVLALAMRRRRRAA
jgi:MYXO-CTERM domain-containing protein